MANILFEPLSRFPPASPAGANSLAPATATPLAATFQQHLTRSGTADELRRAEPADTRPSQPRSSPTERSPVREARGDEAQAASPTASSQAPEKKRPAAADDSQASADEATPDKQPGTSQTEVQPADAERSQPRPGVQADAPSEPDTEQVAQQESDDPPLPAGPESNSTAAADHGPAIAAEGDHGEQRPSSPGESPQPSRDGLSQDGEQQSPDEAGATAKGPTQPATDSPGPTSASLAQPAQPAAKGQDAAHGSLPPSAANGQAAEPTGEPPEGAPSDPAAAVQPAPKSARSQKQSRSDNERPAALPGSEQPPASPARRPVTVEKPAVTVEPDVEGAKAEGVKVEPGLARQPLNAPSSPATGSGEGVSQPAATGERPASPLLARGNPPPPDEPSLNQADQNRFLQRVARAFHAATERDSPLRLRLSPPELGSLRLEVKLQGSAMTARIEAETSQARSLLLDNLPLLRQRLEEQGIRVEQFDVDLMDRQAGDPNDRPTDRQPRNDPGPRTQDPPGVDNRAVETPAPHSAPLGPDADNQLNVVI